MTQHRPSGGLRRLMQDQVIKLDLNATFEKNSGTLY